MQFSIPQPTLAAALQTLIQVVQKKSVLQILNYLRMETNGDTLTLETTNLNTSIRVTNTVSNAEPGTLILEARLFHDVVTSITKTATLHFHTEEDQLTLAYESATMQFTTMDANDFPQFPYEIETPSFAIPGSDLLRLTSKSAFAVAKDATRPNLNGVLLESDGTTITLTATDGHRLGSASIPCNAPETNSILQPSTLQIVNKLKADSVTMAFSPDRVQMDVGNVRINAKLIEGPYPRYRNVVPQQFERTATIATNKLLTSVKSVTKMAKEVKGYIRLDFDYNTVRLGPNQGTLVASVPVESSHGDFPFTIGFDGKYLQELLAKVDTPTMQICMNKNLGAVVFKPVQPGFQVDTTSMYLLLMPVHLEY